MTVMFKRRKLLVLSAAGVVASLVGCPGQGSDSDETPSPGPNSNKQDADQREPEVALFIGAGQQYTFSDGTESYDAIEIEPTGELYFESEAAVILRVSQS
jgi:hypothetical protein